MVAPNETETTEPVEFHVICDVLPDGTIVTLESNLFPEGEGHTIRYSEILPLNPFKRAAFRVLRRVFGERGIVADWTRRWRGFWEAKILSTGETALCRNREWLIEWERKHWENRFEKGTQDDE